MKRAGRGTPSDPASKTNVKAAQIHKTEKRRANKDEREVVLLALLSYEKNETFSNVLVRRTLDDCAQMSTAERAFIKRLLEGVIERLTQLDREITRYTGKSPQRLHPVVRQILRMGIYQILFMDAVPDSAACNEAVRLAKRHAPARLSGFVNGVLRNAARDAASRADTDRAGDAASDKADDTAFGGTADTASGGTADTDSFRTADAVSGQTADTASGKPGDAVSGRTGDFSLRYSMPEWLVRMWTEQLGEAETEALLKSLMEIRPVSVRICGGQNFPEKETLLAQWKDAGVQVQEGRWLPDSFRLRRTSDLRNLPGFAQGMWTVQDESSMLAVTAAGLTGSETVFDVCAAPGGKSFFAAQLLRGGTGSVHSFDLTRKKTDRIREGAQRLGLTNISIEERDARVFCPEFENSADILFCDLPCSGLGVIGKKRDIKYRASLEGIEALRTLQREILTNTVRYLRNGGILIFSTCTISRLENEENAAWIESELGFVPDSLAPYLPAGIPGIRSHMLQLLPHVHGTDGFFIARFRKDSTGMIEKD